MEVSLHQSLTIYTSKLRRYVRAAIVNGLVDAGHNVLITGIGGGVALTALQLCVAKGANVYVTSGNQEKLDKAKELGAKGGAIYKESTCLCAVARASSAHN
jgi:D-arabinose 1-dehydrogenase-like Zn-dependent alcohol dehydrogenase